MMLFDLPTVKKQRLNPRPPVPDTGWRRPESMPDLSGARAIAIDLETIDPGIDEFGPGWARGTSSVCGVSVATDDGFCAYYPVRHQCNENFDPTVVFRWLRRELARPNQVKVGHNIAYDIGNLMAEGVPVVGRLWDTWTAEKLLCHGEDGSLEGTARRRVGEGKTSDALYQWLWEYHGKGKNPTKDALRSMISFVATAPACLAGPYAESDTRLPLEIGKIQHRLLTEAGLMEVFNLECRLIPLILEMRQAGVSVDVAAAENADQRLTDRIVEIQQELNDITGYSFNAGSGDEVGRILDLLGIEYPRTEKTNKPSIKSEFLETIEHPIGGMLIEIQNLKKIQSTFIRSYVLNSHVNGRIFPEFNALRAVTGRMSGSKPNCQNLPSRGPLAETVRSIFVPHPGHAGWFKSDYSSVESRIFAHFAVGPGSEDLRKEYNDNPDTDYHSYTQRMIEEKTGKMLDRKPIKCLNFAKLYSASDRKLAKMLKLSMEEAQPVFDAFNDGLPYVGETGKHFMRETGRKRETRTILNRRAIFDRYVPREFGPSAFPLPYHDALAAYGTHDLRVAHLHKAVNYTVQGSAADLMKSAMVQCYEAGVFGPIGVPKLVVHDELDFSIPRMSPDVHTAIREMVRIMETAIKFSVPIRVASEYGPNWGQTQHFDPSDHG